MGAKIGSAHGDGRRCRWNTEWRTQRCGEECRANPIIPNGWNQKNSILFRGDNDGSEQIIHLNFNNKIQVQFNCLSQLLELHRG
jgi:hypothetical protein